MAGLGLFYCSVVWGATFYMVKDALSAIHPVTMVAYRFLLSAALLAPWILFKRRKFALLREGAVLASLLVPLYVAQTVGLLHTTASNSGFITGLFVLFVPFGMIFFLRQSLSPLQWGSVGLALLGLWMLTGAFRAFNRGDAMTLIAAAAYAGHLLATDLYVRSEVDPVLLAFHQFWMSGAACLAIASATGCVLKVGDVRSAGTIVFLALVPTLSAFLMQLWAQKRVGALRASLIFSLEPCFAALFAWTLGGETLVPGRALGGFLMVSAMLLGGWARPEPSRPVKV